MQPVDTPFRHPAPARLDDEPGAGVGAPGAAGPGPSSPPPGSPAATFQWDPDLHGGLPERRHSAKLDRKSFPALLALPDTDVQLQPGEHQAPVVQEVVHEEVVLGDAGDAHADQSSRTERRRDGPPILKTQKVKTKRLKLTAPSTWLKIDNKGEASLIQVDKHKLTHKLGVQTRDLRILDPQLAASSPPAILDRDKAIVVNLENAKCIITLNYVLVVNPELESSAPLVAELKAKLATGRMGKKALSYTGLSDAASNVRMVSSATGGLDLPFELKALEVCLDLISVQLDDAAKVLEAEAYPTLDSLTHKVNTSNLERTRRIKNRLVRIKTRVETIREVLEKFLDDDEDMHRLHLTGNEISRQVSLMEPHKMEQDGSSVSGASSDSSADEAETAAVEMLLEAYFMYLDSTYNRLQTLHEYIGDTEDLVSIKLDQHRNQLIALDLVLTIFQATLGILTAVGGYFGMNLYSGLEEDPNTFLQVCVTTTVGALLLFVLIVHYLWRSKLLTY